MNLDEIPKGKILRLLPERDKSQKVKIVPEMVPDYVDFKASGDAKLKAIPIQNVCPKNVINRTSNPLQTGGRGSRASIKFWINNYYYLYIPIFNRCSYHL